jgi:hypothetical protein
MTLENLIYALVGLAVGGVFGVWGGTYLGKLWAKVETFMAKEKNAAESDAAHVKALFSEVKILYQEFDAKAKADADAVAKAAKVVVTETKSL